MQPEHATGKRKGQLRRWSAVTTEFVCLAGMSAGIPKYVTVNLTQLAAFKEGEEVSLESLKDKHIVNVSGKEAKLPLKVWSCRIQTPPQA